MDSRSAYWFKCFLIFGSLCLPLVTYAQTIENVKAVFQDGKVIVHYDLKADPNTPFAVELYASHNNYNLPIKLAQGDIGNEVKPGLNKRVEWDIKADLKKYKGEITFELHAEPALLPWTIKEPAGLKRGKMGTIQWQGGKASQEVKLELYQGTNRIESITPSPVANTKKYEWNLPSSLKTGSGYTIKLSSGKDEVTSASFKINSKIPLVVKIVPVAILAGWGISKLFGTNPPPPVDDDLADAPGIPN
jgi:hypothetical protein